MKRKIAISEHSGGIGYTKDIWLFTSEKHLPEFVECDEYSDDFGVATFYDIPISCDYWLLNKYVDSDRLEYKMAHYQNGKVVEHLEDYLFTDDPEKDEIKEKWNKIESDLRSKYRTV